MQGKVKDDSDITSRPWIKPPPLESISISSSEYKGNYFLRLCALLNVITGVTGLASALLHIYILFSDAWVLGNVANLVIRMYFTVFGFCIVLQERENPSFFHR